ncbi:hypothetical protein R1080702_228 [Cyanophage S-RIM32]|uniref:Uncharacterized protein n=1 Tax=Cyanophage S-RIM32 TaxID=1278479 RepID=A0A127KMB3_9CAUD|nr:hypothetical protein BJD26_gp032 [Cyanophage S-RIM32]AMO43233.1 hypothetical protein R1080702_228 [Cyanophage S-RIM32]
MEMTPQEQREVLRIQPSRDHNYCLLFWKMSDGPACKKKVLRRINSNGVPVSTEKYSEVFMYGSVADALVHGKFLISRGYDLKIMSCNRRGKDKFWVT